MERAIFVTTIGFKRHNGSEISLRLKLALSLTGLMTSRGIVGLMTM